MDDTLHDSHLPELLDGLIDLTAQRERRHLQLTLLTTLRDLLPGATVSLYNCRWIDGRPWWRPLADRDDAELAPWRLPGAALLPIIEQKLPRQDCYQMDTGVCVPLYHQGQVIGVLLVNMVDDSEPDTRLLTALARIHENFLGLLHVSDSDELTGLGNRRLFDQHLFRALSQAPQRGRRRFLALLDIDHFKQVNDRYGHLIGDEVLLMLGQYMQRHFGPEDGLYRYGGEEFALLLLARDGEQALSQLEAFCRSLASSHFPQVPQVTASIGLAALEGCRMPSEALERADKALYYAKQHGRNQACTYETLEAQGLVSVVQAPSSDIDLF